jgi:UDP-glucose 4-epimerase
MKIVVTGAMGHIGSYLVRDLVTPFPDAEIVMIDNMLTQRFSSLFNLPAAGRYRFIEADVTRLDLVPVFEGADTVIHLAALTDAAGSFDRAAEVEANNYKATSNVATACVETGARMISLSSTSVYGTQQKVVAEDCATEDLKPQSPYALIKLKEEELVTRLCAQKGLRGVSFRFGTIFGISPGMRFHTAVNRFCWQASLGQPITVWTTAYDQKRPYLDLRDASRAIAFAMNKNLFDGRIYNVASENATPRKIVEIIREFVPDLDVTFVDSEIMNQLSYEVSCTRILSQGFSFVGDLRRGIRDTLALFDPVSRKPATRC